MRGPTRWLLGATLGVVAADVAVNLAPRPTAAVLPELPGFDPAVATRLEVGTADERTILERRGEGWWLVAPQDGAADRTEVEAALSALSGGVRPVARVDEGDHERYGLGGGDELRVDVRSGEAGLLSVLVGRDAGGGDTWVRLPGADDVYRAHVGGRALFDRPASAWRDRQVVDLDPASVTALTLRAGGRELRAERTSTGFSGGVDQEAVARVIAELAHLRAAEVVQDAPVGLADVELSSVTGSVELQFGAASGRVFVRRDGRPEVFRVVLPWAERLADPSFFEDRAVWTVPPASVSAVRAEGPGWDGAIRREPDGSLRLLRPANLVVDEARLRAVVSFLSEPRVSRWQALDPALAGFEGRRWVIETDQGRRVLEVGASTEGHTFVRDAARPDRVGWLDATLVGKLMTVFGGA